MPMLLRTAAVGFMLATILAVLVAAVVLGGCGVPGTPGPMVNIGTVTVTQSPATTTTQNSTASRGKPWPAPAVAREREPVDRCRDCGS